MFLDSNVMNGWAVWSKMAAVWHRRSPLTNSAHEPSRVYIYIYVSQRSRDLKVKLWNPDQTCILTNYEVDTSCTHFYVNINPNY